MDLTTEQIQERIATINLLLTQGCNRLDIADAIGISRQALWNFIDKHSDEIVTPETIAVKGYFGWVPLAKAFGLTRIELAAKTVDYDTLSRSWSPDSPNRPNPDTVSKVAKGLGLPVAAVYLYLYEITTDDMPAIMQALKAQRITGDEIGSAMAKISYDWKEELE